MPLANLRYVSEDVVEELRANIDVNIDRYASGSFNGMAANYGWAAELKTVQVDDELLRTLEGGSTTPEVEIKNSLIVHTALKGMSRAVAREERVWVRLTHIECLEYSRSRWLAGGEVTRAKIDDHFFAGTLNQTRDDNAVARLWWNAEIAKIAYPEDAERALRAILRSADTRSNFVERSRIASRPALARAIVRALEEDEWLIAKEENFRIFMRMLNRNGGGILFETMSQADVDAFVATCSEQAQEVFTKAA